MSIDYILDYGCQPKKLLGLAGVLDGGKVRRQAQGLAAAGITSGDSVSLVRITPEGKLHKEELTPQELAARAAGYEIHAGHCRGCPANVMERLTKSEQLFGCHGALDFPLTSELEFLLYVTLRYVADHQLDTPRARLIHFIIETDITGDIARNARENKPEPGAAPFAARMDPLSYTFNGPKGEVTIDTDQIMDVLFFVPLIDARTAAFLYVPFFQTMEDMIKILVQQASLGANKRLADRGIVQLRAFGSAVTICAELGCNILVDQ